MMCLMQLDVFEIEPYTVRLWCTYTFFIILLWSPLLLLDKRRWTYIINLFLDIWIVGNLVYFRSYGDALSRWCLASASNMNGIWDATLPFFSPYDILFLLSSIGWIFISEFVHFKYTLSRVKQCLIALTALIICAIPQTVMTYKHEQPISPFFNYYGDISTMERVWYIHTYGPIAHFLNESLLLIFNKESTPKPITPEEVAPFICSSKDTKSIEDGNLIFVFFESLEYWTINLDVENVEVTPNLNLLITNPHTGFYPMNAQVRDGKSSDALLTATTGLLPIYNGATCMRYAGNTFPSLVQSSNALSKQMFAACPEEIWNQGRMAKNLGFDSLYAEAVSDKELIRKVNHCIEHAPQPFIFLVTTMASHSPFTEYANSSNWQIKKAYSTDVRNYLQCVHYTDACLGEMINTIMSNSLLAATTRIIITGDHPIFDMETPIPFIIYDPFIPPVSANRQLYQIDIYTTLIERMHIASPWHGLGKNISDSCAYTTEEIKHLESLSNRIIQTNYFAVQE